MRSVKSEAFWNAMLYVSIWPLVALNSAIKVNIFKNIANPKNEINSHTK